MASEAVGGASTAASRSIGFSASRESIALRRLLDAAAASDRSMSRRLGLKSMDMTAMSILTSAREDMGPRELSQRLGITPAAATELVDRLESAGHLVRLRDTADRRRVHLRPTASAIAEVGANLRELVENLDGIAADYSDQESTIIVDFLEKATRELHRFATDK
jgi:DNA-binding MarR family transcriptional regulator